MSDDALIEAMARAIFDVVISGAEFVPPNDDWKYCIEDAKAALAVARPIIEAPLRAENEKLRAALKPCVDYFSWNGGLIRDEEYEAAAAALKA